ncbi:MAG TPA: hypothetical protein VG095_10475, partial [Chthoniobacterales bacterium]|nr:hypothetical protein [Chthoniobacterales bacterium]
MHSLNDTAAHASTWQGLKWRLEAWRTGHRFQDVALLRSLVYRVEAVFLVHRNTGFPLLHVTAEAAATQDGDLIAGMLSDIQDFARDLLEEGDNGLKEFRIRDPHLEIANP